MDTSLNIPVSSSTAATPAAPIVERAMTSRVQAITTSDDPATLPADKPFVAQVVAAQLSGTDFPENPSEIAPPERTLRPYDVPMLPADTDDETEATPQVADDLGSANAADSETEELTV